MVGSLINMTDTNHINMKNTLPVDIATPKIAFFGTSDKTTEILDALHKSFDLQICFTKHPTKVGRKRELRQTAVQVWAQNNNIEVKLISSLKGIYLAEVERLLLSEGVKICVVADFDYIIPSKLLIKQPYEMINIHFSALPKYRGASPVQHALLNGDPTIGITYQLIDSGMDTGDILYQSMHKVQNHETTLDVQHKLFTQAAKEIKNVITGYMDKTLSPKKQNGNLATYCYSLSHPKSTYIYKEDAQIKWKTQSLKQIHNMVRAFYPWPIAFTYLKDLEGQNIDKTGINHGHRSEFRLKPTLQKQKKNLRVKVYKTKYTNPNKLEILEIQVEGKNKTTWGDFLNGYYTTLPTNIAH